MLIYNFETRWRRTNGRTDQRTDRPTDHPTDRRTLSRIELLSQLKKNSILRIGSANVGYCSSNIVWCWSIHIRSAYWQTKKSNYFLQKLPREWVLVTIDVFRSVLNVSFSDEIRVSITFYIKLTEYGCTIKEDNLKERQMNRRKT